VSLAMLSFFFFSFFSPPLKFTLAMENFRVVLLFIRISISILIILISKFFFLTLCKILIWFQFHPSISICEILFFFQFNSSSFDFFSILLNWFYFSISPFNQKFILIFFFNFDPYSFNCFFIILLGHFF
jgi:hypothetical protein